MLRNTMKCLFYLFLPFVDCFMVPFQPNESYCCRYATFKEDCHGTCLELVNRNDSKYLDKLREHLPKNCPKESPDLREFWNCIEGPFNHSIGAWYGKFCCELAITDHCRTSCLQAKERNGVVRDCNPLNEEAFYRCVFKQESRQRCCGKRLGLTNFCRHRCDVLFRSEMGPTHGEISNLRPSCDTPLLQCMHNYTSVIRSKTVESIGCCKHASNEDCQTSCVKILKSEMKDDVIISNLLTVCGEIVPHEPLWRCFLEGSTPARQSSPFVTSLQCCSRALSTNCKQLCSKVHGNPWPESSVWYHFERQCEHNPDEVALQQCLQEVSEPCTMGCRNLSFCTNFNDRPTSLFRSCSVESDDIAREHFNSWSAGTIVLPFIEIPVKNILQCQPESWKAVACSLQTKPCNSKTGISMICKADCISLLNNCADKDRFHSGMKVEELCESLSPSYLQENCISLKDYTKPSSVVKTQEEVNHPCNPTPCKEDEVCLINRRKCVSGHNCPKFRCLQGCKMEHGSRFVVSHGSVVRLLDPARGEGCFKSCMCSTSGDLRSCVDLPCTDEPKDCRLAGQLRRHGEKFQVQCNMCSCFSGNITCTNRQCPITKEQILQHTGMPCNCPRTYSPVCGINGRTYPSSCVALCLGQTTRYLTLGACPSKNSCKSNLCNYRERCVFTPRTCLTDVGNCQQYECIPPYKKCLNLLNSAISLLEGKAYHHHERQRQFTENENILSSSFFFSNSALLSNDSGLCDVKNHNFSNICKLTRSKKRKLAYSGSCQDECEDKNSEPVCGQDHVTYKHSCMAEGNGVLVDYPGPCKANILPATTGNGKELKCEDVTCPLLSRSGCDTIRPPGSCCPLCGTMLRILINQEHLQSLRKTAWNGPLTVRDIISLLRIQLHVYECQIYGHLSNEGDMVVVVVSTKLSPTLIQEEACAREAERLYNLIDSRSPMLTTHLALSSLTAASITPSSPGGAEVIMLSKLTLFLALSWHIVFYS